MTKITKELVEEHGINKEEYKFILESLGAQNMSEMLLRKYKIVEGKKFVGLYSTKRKKQYAEQIISKFFSQYKLQPINKQIELAQKVSIKRPPYTIIKQRLLGLLNK